MLFFRHAQCPSRTNVRRRSALITATTNVRKKNCEKNAINNLSKIYHSNMGKVRTLPPTCEDIEKKAVPCGWDAVHSHYFLSLFLAKFFRANFFLTRLRHLHNRTTYFEVEKKVFSLEIFCWPLSLAKKEIQKLSIDGQAMKVARLF